MFTAMTRALFSSDGEHFYKDKLLLSPVSRRFEVSSPFNPARRHPITHKVTSHLGTDYAVPVGTPVVSISSGRVVISRYHWPVNTLSSFTQMV